MKLIIQKFTIQISYSFLAFSKEFEKTEKNNGFLSNLIASNEIFYSINNEIFCYYLTNNIINPKQNALSSFEAKIKLMPNNNVTCEIYFKKKIFIGYFALAFFILYLGFFNDNTVKFFPLFALFIGTIILYRDSQSFKKYMVQKLTYEWAEYLSKNNLQKITRL